MSLKIFSYFRKPFTQNVNDHNELCWIFIISVCVLVSFLLLNRTKTGKREKSIEWSHNFAIFTSYDCSLMVCRYIIFVYFWVENVIEDNFPHRFLPMRISTYTYLNVVSASDSLIQK